MTGDWRLDWPLLAVSLFNTILLTWLGLTVLLNAEHRDWGVWLVGGGLVSGALFFISHSALLGIGVDLLNAGIDFWWHLGWLPLVACPLAWYLAVLWFSGYWDEGGGALRKRQGFWLAVCLGSAAGLLGLIFFSGVLPPLSQLALNQTGGLLRIAGVPVLPAGFSAYILLTLILSMDALYRPAEPARVLAGEARRRARPWLTAVAACLLLVSFLVGAFVVSILAFAGGSAQPAPAEVYRLVAWFDLAIAMLIGLAILLIGQAIVVYEIFTGKPLPRQGLHRAWRRTIWLGLGYSALVSGSFALGLEPIYSLLLTAVIMTVFYALLHWRQAAERERLMQQLQPFVESAQLYDRLLSAAGELPGADQPFSLICRELLGCRLAFLVPAGPLAPLVRPLVYPEGDAPEVRSLLPQFEDPQLQFVFVDPQTWAGAEVAIPLWSSRGLFGILLLGAKTDGSLYAVEEIEIARSVCERLLDMEAGAELSRRLILIQRGRLTESRVADQRIRRRLHDDILPELHTAILMLDRREPEIQTKLFAAHRGIADLLAGMPRTTGPDFQRRGLPAALRDLVEGELSGEFDQAEIVFSPGAEAAAAALTSLEAEVLYFAAREALRNASGHARVAGRPLAVRVRADAGNPDRSERLVLAVQDNGPGLRAAGAEEEGHGLQLHGTLMAIVGGTLTLESEPGEYTRVVLRL